MMSCNYKIEMSDDVEESVELLQREMNAIRTEMAKEKHMNVDTVETHLRLAMREIADIKAELSTLPESQAFSVNIDEYQNELKNITMQLSNKNNIQYTPHNNNNNDACY